MILYLPTLPSGLEPRKAIGDGIINLSKSKFLIRRTQDGVFDQCEIRIRWALVGSDVSKTAEARL